MDAGMSTVFWYNFVDSGILLHTIFTISQRWWLFSRWYLYNIYVVVIKKLHNDLFISYNISIFFNTNAVICHAALICQERFYCLPKGSIGHHPTFTIASLKNFLLAFLVNELHLLLAFCKLQNSNFSHLFIIALLSSVVIKGA